MECRDESTNAPLERSPLHEHRTEEYIFSLTERANTKMFRRFYNFKRSELLLLEKKLINVCRTGLNQHLFNKE